jgi:hypothetical protein
MELVIASNFPATPKKENLNQKKKHFKLISNSSGFRGGIRI